VAETKLKILRVSIDFLPPKMMRYRTVGDWFFSQPGYLRIQVADTGNWIYGMLVAIHELVEVFLCTAQGVTQKQVDRFDFAHELDDDPGEHPRAPYHEQHMLALSVEMMLATVLGIKWRPYGDCLTRTWAKTPRKKHAS
jgi:hypothetical protein